MKRVGLLSVLVLPVFLVCPANALTYQDGSDVQFTFNSTLSISLSDTDLIIGNLIPGQDDLSNAVDVVVNTNNLYGYTLTATVGDATKDYRDLRHTNGTTNIASIDVNSDLSTLSGQSSSVWGYTVSTNGTTWSNYNGLPKYDDTANTAELRATDGAAADSTTSFKIGAYAEEGQLAGDYTNVINFKVVTNSGQTNMQDITASSCPTTPTTVVDVRDGEEYTIQQLADGNCWMLDNLRLDLTTTSLDTLKGNTNAPDIALEYLKGVRQGTTGDYYAKTAASYWIDSAYYDRPLLAAVHKNDIASVGNVSGKIGILYNFCAATAGTYCSPDYPDDDIVIPDDEVPYDICPTGWHLPHNEDGQLVAAYPNDLENAVLAFRAIFSGNAYSDWDVHTDLDFLTFDGIGEYGYWWTGRYDGAGYAYILFSGFGYSAHGQADTLRISNASGLTNEGLAVRCVLK